jgi:hypothetical protein
MGMHEQAGVGAVDAMLTRYRDVTEAVRAAYQRVLGIGS